MEILKAIDLISQNRIVRWALMVTIVAITVLYVYLRIQYFALDMECRELKVQNSEYIVKINLQNEAVQRAAEDYQYMVKQIDVANGKLQSMKKQMDKRKAEIRQIVLTGTCDQQVRQVLEEIRK